MARYIYYDNQASQYKYFDQGTKSWTEYKRELFLRAQVSISSASQAASEIAAKQISAD